MAAGAGPAGAAPGPAWPALASVQGAPHLFTTTRAMMGHGRGGIGGIGLAQHGRAGREKYAQLIDREVPTDAGALNADMVAMYMVSAHMGLIKWWLDGGMVYTPSAMARAVDRLSVRGVLASIGLAGQGWIPK